jgi:hypothetical protein
MKKSRLTISVLIIALSTLVSGWYLPWWFAGITAFVCGFAFIRRGYTAFITGFVTSGLMSCGLAFYKDYGAEVSIAKLVSGIFGNIGTLPVYLISGTMIAFIAGFWALSGNYLYKVVSGKLIK